jgi:putative Mn2+ efflux pump MntP
VLGLILVAAALGLSNFAAAIGIGLSGVDARVRLRVAIVFGVFEAAMPLLGLFLGRQLAASFGSASSYVGGGLLVGIGGYTLFQARRRKPAEPPVVAGTGGRLVVTGAALSIDNLVVGFALGTHKVPLALAAVIIGVVSVGMSLAGLELGDRLGAVTEKWSGEIGAVVLMLVGAAIASRLF